ncbi:MULTISPECIES: ATP-binding protein [Cyanophyceae]|uniref:ATP-binding protein n=1 Tax=Cyanophyceae TaxID=3028117 RepID=UPI001682D366|nr:MULTISPECIES: ATP-binding protein [unclassified Phormidium]MBD1915036.1 response regulator [Phormidium sp. FACHB-77]MBD2030784.1 response regulator [Phormidium sp. FACHB-322]MBD2053137.1 response regulator [Leptolyngbya sp. FACHB-60]
MLLVLLAVIPALGLILYTAAVQRRTAAVESQENLLRLTKFAAAHQRQTSEGARQLLIALSQIPDLREGDAEACNQLLADLVEEYGAYAGFGVANRAGYIICSTSTTTQPVYVGDRLYFQLARDSRDFAIGNYQIGRITKQADLSFGYPILDDVGQVQAVVIAALDLAWLEQSAAAVDLPQGAVMTITDRNGVVLVRYPDSPRWVGVSLPDSPVTQIVLKQQEGTAVAKGLDGVERYYGFATLSDSVVDQAIHIRIGVPKSFVVDESNRLLAQNLFALAGVTALALVAAWVGGDVFLTRKVKSLVQTAHQLRGGNLGIRTELSYQFGELGQLAQAFDEMASALEAREQAIAALNQDLQTLFEVIPIGVLIAQDAEFRQVRSNPAFAQILGLDPKENVSYTPVENPPPAYKLFREDRELAPNEFPLRYAAIHNTEVKGTEVDVVRGDGSRFSLFGYAKPLLNHQGQVRGSVAAFLDISDRKQAELEREQLLHRLETSLGQLEAVINSMTEGLVIADPEGQIVTFNPVALALHGYDSVEQVQQSLPKFADLFETQDLQGRPIPLGEWPMTKALQGETFDDYELRVHRRDTGKTWIGSYNGTPVQDKQGRIMLAIITVRDITAQRQAQLALTRSLAAEQAARAEAETANRIKDEFLAVLSHELRTPLNPILGWSKLLRSRQYDAATTDRALETIERNAQLQTQLIGDLLDVSRILQGKLQLVDQAVDLRATIQAAVETVQLAADAKTVEIQTVFDAAEGKVSGDPNRLQQVIWNLLSNAVKFSPAGGRVEVTLERVLGSSPWPWSAASAMPGDSPSAITHAAQIRVTDSGQGIAPEFLPHVFETFRQADSATTRQFGGLGLGLAIARHIVELHGGSIAANSPGLGQGATFAVRLPLRSAWPEAEVDRPPVAPGGANPTPLKGVKVLLVDDEIDTRDVFSFLLEQAGAEVVAVASAAAALAALPQLKPDLLLSDIGMPNINGYQLMRQIRTLPPEQGGTLAAIALTAYAGELDQQQALAAGFQLHLAKPVEPKELIGAIATLGIGHASSAQETG